MQDKSSYLSQGFKYASENPKAFGAVFLGTAALLGTFGYFAYQRTDDANIKVPGFFEIEKKERNQKIGNIDGGAKVEFEQEGKGKVDNQEIGNVKSVGDMKFTQNM